MDFKDIEKSLGLSEEKIIKYFFPYLLLKQLRHNFETGNYTNLSGTRDQIIINLLGPESTPSDVISNFDLNIIKDMLEDKNKLNLIVEETKFEIQKKSEHKDSRGPKGKLYSVNDTGKKILDLKKQDLKYFLELIIKFPQEDKFHE